MAGIRFILNKDLQGRVFNTGARVAANLANVARQTGSTIAVEYVKKAVYDKLLTGGLPYFGNKEEWLSKDGQVSPFASGDNRYPVRNVLIFKANDESLQIQLWDVKIDMTFENTIVKTAVTKRRGTIKEYICAKDYSFNVAGSLIADSQSAFPITELQELIKLFAEEKNIGVSNVYIESFGVTKVVLESASVPQSSAKYVNAIPFNLKLVSDDDIELSIVE